MKLGGTSFLARWCIAVLIVSAVWVGQAQEPTVRNQRNLAEMAAESAVILHGNIVSAKVEPHPSLTHLTTVLVTVHVRDALKGNATERFVFRQYVWDVRARYDGTGYVKGQEVLLFLRAPSRYGLTSPAGLQQGRFIIQRDASGSAKAVNGTGNAGLFDRLGEGLRASRVSLPAGSVKRDGPADLGELKQAIRAIVEAEQ